MRYGSQLWMTENLDYDTGDSLSRSYPSSYSDYASKHKLGRLYSAQNATNWVQPGWRLPTPTDWNTLRNFFGGDPLIAYAALIDEGASGFNAQLGGYYGSYFADVEVNGRYCSDSADQTSYQVAFFYGARSKFYMDTSYAGYYFSLRFVKDLIG